MGSCCTCLQPLAERVVALMLVCELTDEVRVPSFDHGVGDPVEDDIAVRPRHRVALVEGNYLLLGK